MTTTDLLERALSPGLRVDKTAGVIRGVRVIGPNSRNRRRYLSAAFRPDLYEGKPVHFDHPPEAAPNSQRRVSRRVGWLENVRRERGGLCADLHVLTPPPTAPRSWRRRRSGRGCSGVRTMRGAGAGANRG